MYSDVSESSPFDLRLVIPVSDYYKNKEQGEGIALNEKYEGFLVENFMTVSTHDLNLNRKLRGYKDIGLTLVKVGNTAFMQSIKCQRHIVIWLLCITH